MYARLPPGSLQQAGAQLLLLVSLSVTGVVVTLADRVPARQEGDGASALLYWMSPAWQLWNEAPTYVAGPPGAATLRVLLWLGVLAALALLSARTKAISPGRASLAATTVATAVSIALVSMTAAMLSDAGARFDVEGRVRFPLLETFDPVARPIALRYDAFSIVRPEDLPPLFTLSATAGSRTAPQPLRVVLNARFRLPAGEYVLDLKGSESGVQNPDGAIALQIGREGRPVQAWRIVVPPGGHVRQPFHVPLDAEFVGFRAPRQVEAVIAQLRVSAVSVVETRRRFRTPTVLSAAPFGPATIFFPDSNAFAEREGFWVKGRATARMTLRPTIDGASRFVLAIHSGARANAVELAIPGWSQKLDLVPGVTQRIEVPAPDGQTFVPLTISAAGGFVPAEIDASRDRRLLGAWIAFIPDDISRTSSGP